MDILFWDLTVQYGADEARHAQVLRKMNAKEVPETFSHDEIMALNDLDETFANADVDGLINELESQMQAWT